MDLIMYGNSCSTNRWFCELKKIKDGAMPCAFIDYASCINFSVLYPEVRNDLFNNGSLVVVTDNFIQISTDSEYIVVIDMLAHEFLYVEPHVTTNIDKNYFVDIYNNLRSERAVTFNIFADGTLGSSVIVQVTNQQYKQILLDTDIHWMDAVLKSVVRLTTDGIDVDYNKVSYEYVKPSTLYATVALFCSEKKFTYAKLIGCVGEQHLNKDEDLLQQLEDLVDTPVFDNAKKVLRWMDERAYDAFGSDVCDLQSVSLKIYGYEQNLVAVLAFKDSTGQNACNLIFNGDEMGETMIVNNAYPLLGQDW